MEVIHISAYRSEEPLRDAINSSTSTSSFIDGWKCIGSGRFGKLKEFCGGLGTVFSGRATVESDFSIVNFEKNDYRTALTDLSLEGILLLRSNSILYRVLLKVSKANESIFLMS